MKRLGTWGIGLALLWANTAGAVETVYYIHTDALGSPVAMTDANRHVVERTQYGPYGEVLNRPEHDGPGYTGHEEDAATGLTNMQQRYDDKVIGRFLSVDPVQPDGNTGGSFNRYAYANDNPYRYTDPDGRWSSANPDAYRGRRHPGPPCLDERLCGLAMGSQAQVTPVRAFNVGHKAYIQYADGATEVRSGSRPWRDNNPGDLRKGSDKAASNRLGLGWDYSPTGPHDKVTAKQPFAIFSLASVGDRALRETLTSVYGNDTVGQAIHHFAPSADSNNPQQYAAFITGRTGASASATINSLTPAQLSGTVGAIKAQEGFNNGGSVEIYNFGSGPFSQ